MVTGRSRAAVARGQVPAVTLLGLFALSLGLGFAGGNLAETYAGELVRDTLTRERCAGGCPAPHEPRYGAGWIVERTDGDIYAYNRPNISGWADSWGVKPFRVETNARGMRDESFAVPRPDGTYRIIVLGTSTTLGYGVNRSDTFTEIVERRLDADSPDTDIQVLNAGSPAYGMKDYYRYITARALSYDPDMIVIAFNDNDWYSRRQTDLFNREARWAVQRRADYENLTDVQRERHFRRNIFRLLQDAWARQDVSDTGMRHLEDIRTVLGSNGVPAVFYALDTLRYPGQEAYVESWAAAHGVTIHYAPEEWRESTVGDPERVSSWDSHPSPMGHRIIADGLERVLRRELARRGILPDRP